MRLLPPVWHIDIINNDILPLRSKEHILETAKSLGLQKQITEEQFIKLKKTIYTEIFNKINSNPIYVSQVKRMGEDCEPNAKQQFRGYTIKPLEKEIRSLFEVQKPQSLTSWIWSLFTTSS